MPISRVRWDTTSDRIAYRADAARRLSVFEVHGPGALQAYLRQAVLNRVRNELRKRGRRPEATDLDGRELALGQSPLEAAIGKEAVVSTAGPSRTCARTARPDRAR